VSYIMSLYFLLKLQPFFSIYSEVSNIIGYNNSFIRLISSNEVQYINDSLSGWQSIFIEPDLLDIFQGYDGDVYLLQHSVGQECFYKVNEQNIELLFSDGDIISPPCLSLYKTKNYFYLSYNQSTNSILRFDNSGFIFVNNNSIGDTIYDVAVSEEDIIYSIVEDAGTINLKHVIQQDVYVTMHSFGNTGSEFKVKFLDNEHLVVASKGNTDGYNGLFIYNINKQSIEKFISTSDAVALYIPL
ncbi:MAG: hypothetical protein WHV26_15360, partial [Spirochaetota bacterium]